MIIKKNNNNKKISNQNINQKIRYKSKNKNWIWKVNKINRKKINFKNSMGI
jgi:hypothetical protein